MGRKLSPYMIIKGLRYLRHFGWKGFWVRLLERMEPEHVPYGPWYEQHRASGDELARQRKEQPKGPKISIAVPVYRTPLPFLQAMIDSVRSQSYENWELCIANASPDDAGLCALLEKAVKGDARIRVKQLTENKGIAENTNAAFAMAQGAFTGLLDHDDLLAPDALYHVARAVLSDEQIDLLYTDEDKVSQDGEEHFAPNLKPEFNPDLLCANNYICHFLVVRTELLRRLNGERPGYNGAQDYDLIFRASEEARRIYHIPRILYHWRTHSASTADNPLDKRYAYEAGRRAIADHLERIGEPGEVTLKKELGFYRVKYPVQGSPLVSILIPNKDQKETLEACIRSIKEKTTYANYELIIIENNSTTEEIFAYYRELEREENIRVVRWDGGFNYSAINNYGAGFAKGEYLLLLNNDITVITPDWMEELLGHCQRKETGIVGAKLYYPDNTVQHAGIIIGIGGVAGNIFTGLKRERSGYLHKASLQQELSAVTAACMLVKRSVFDEVGGLEEELQVAFNDVDFCLKVGRRGYRVVFTPYAELYHHESKTRGAENTKEKVHRFQREIEYMRSHWLDILKEGDPYYNPNLSLSRWDYSLKSR